MTLHRIGDRQAIDPQVITAFLAASAFDQEEFMIASGTSSPDTSTLDLASRVAQAVAVIRGERPLSVGAMPLADLDWQHFHGRNIAVIGTNAELGQFVNPAEMSTWIDGRPFIRRLPSDPDHVALFFGGDQIAAVRRAVDGFTGMVTRPLDPPRLVEVNGTANLLPSLSLKTYMKHWVD